MLPNYRLLANTSTTIRWLFMLDVTLEGSHIMGAALIKQIILQLNGPLDEVVNILMYGRTI